MTIPKNKRRTIVVNGTRYEYCITGFVTVYIKNLDTGNEFSWWEDWKRKWSWQIGPKDIRKLIVDSGV